MRAHTQHKQGLYPGYAVAAVGTLAYIATAPGQTFIVSTLNTPLREAFGIGELQLNTTYAVATVLAAFPLVLVGRMTDRLGPRATLVIVAAAFAAACALMSAANGLLTAFLGFFLLRFLGQGSLSLVAQHSVAMWFHDRLGTIHGLKQVITFVSWIFLPQLVLALMGEVGWRTTYLILGASVAVLVIPAALRFVVNRPEDLGMGMDGRRTPEPNHADNPADDPTHQDPTHQDPTLEADPPGVADAAEAHELQHEQNQKQNQNQDQKQAHTPRGLEPDFNLREAGRTRAYWLLIAATTLPPLVGTAVLFDSQPIAAEIGLTKAQAATAVSAWTAGMGLMALPSGLLVDRIPPRALIPAGTALFAAACIAVLASTGLITLVIAMAALAVGQSVVSSCTAAATARYFGRKHHGSIRSAVTRFAVIGTGVGPVFTALSARYTGSYDASLWLFAAMSLPVALACLTLRAPTPPARPNP